MMQDHAVVHGNPWEYLFPEPRLHLADDPRLQTRGTLSRLVGVDGRCTGRLRRFPGFEKAVAMFSTADRSPDLGGSVTENFVMQSNGGFTFFKPFVITDGPSSSFLIRGFAFVGHSSGGAADSEDRVYIAWTTNAGGTLNVIYLNTQTSNITGLDMIAENHFLYFAGKTANNTKIEFLSRYCGSTGDWRVVNWNPVPQSHLTTVSSIIGLSSFGGTDAGEDSRGASHLVSGQKYGICLRVVYPDQGFFGPLLEPTEVLGAINPFDPISTTNLLQGGTGFLYMPISAISNDVASGNVFTRAVVQCIRTVPNNYTDQKQIGFLHVESEWEIPRYTGSMKGTSSAWTALSLTTPSTTGVLVGDIVYLALHESATGLDSVIPGLVWRRRVTAVTATSITWDLPIPDVTPIAAGFENALHWYVSRTFHNGTTVFDSTGTFICHDGAESAKMRVRWGWERSVLRYRYSAVVGDTPTGYSDDALVQLPEVIPQEFSVFPKGNPLTSQLLSYENLHLRVTQSSNDTNDVDLSVLRWGDVGRSRKGLTPVLNRRRPNDLSDEILGLLQADPFAVVLLNNGIWRIHRSGDRLSVDPIHNRHGASSLVGAISVGTQLYFTSPIGALLADLSTGEVLSLNATQRIFDETSRWRGTVAQVQAAYDGEVGALVFLNPSVSECLILWLNHGLMTFLEGVPFQRVMTAVHPTSGGRQRALFVLDTSGNRGVYTFNAARTALSYTTAGELNPGSPDNIVFNATLTSGTNSTTLQFTGVKSAFLIGHYAYILRAGQKTWQRSRITALGGGGYTVSPAYSPAPAIGDRVSIAPIPFRMSAWPLRGDGEVLQDMFRIKKTISMCGFFADIAGDTGGSNPNKKILYQLFDKNVADKNTGAEGSITDSPASNVTEVADNGQILIPGMETYGSNLDFSLLGLLVTGTMEGSRIGS